MKASRTKRKLLVLGATAALLAIAAGVSYAAIPSQNGTISSCTQKAGGVRYLRLIDVDEGETCKSTEQPLSWNQQGPQGPPGPQGPAGPQGPVGPSSASDGYVQVVSHSIIGGSGQPKTVATLSLPAGKYLLLAKGYFLAANASGGCTLTGPQGDDVAVAYQPTAAAEIENFSLMAPAVYSTGGDATLSCLSQGGLEVYQIKLAAIELANLNAPSGWTADTTQPPPWGNETKP